MRLSVRRLVAIGFLCVALPANAAHHLLKDQSEVDRVPEVAQAMQAVGEKVLNPALHPILPEIQKDALKLIELVQTERERNSGETVYLVLTRSAQENMHFIQLKPKVKLILMNIGFLGNAGEDSEIVGALGHEYEHGWSQLQDRIDSMEPNSLAMRIMQNGLQRAVENEVDIKSVFLRMIPAGADPYAFERLIRRWRTTYGGDGSDQSHTTHTSREDTLAIALTAARRELGQRIDLKPTVSLPTNIVQVLQSNDFLETIYPGIIVKELESEFSEIPEKVNALFRFLLAPKSSHDRSRPQWGPRNLDYSLESVLQWHWDTHIRPQLPPRVPVELYLPLRKKYIQTIAEAYQQAIETLVIQAPAQNDEDLRTRLALASVPKLAAREARIKNDIEVAKKSLTEWEELAAKDSESESIQEYLEERKRELEWHEQTLYLFEQELDAWTESIPRLTEARAALIADNVQLLNVMSIRPDGLLDLVGTTRQDAIWRALDVFSQSAADGESIRGAMSIPDPVLWKQVYELDHAAAAKAWRSYLSHVAKHIARSDSAHAPSAIKLVVYIRRELGAFGLYPEYEAAIGEIIHPAMIAYADRVVKKLTTTKPEKEVAGFLLFAQMQDLLSVVMSPESNGEKFNAPTYVEAGVLPAWWAERLSGEIELRLQQTLESAISAMPEQQRPQSSTRELLALFSIVLPDAERAARWRTALGHSEPLVDLVDGMSKKLASRKSEDDMTPEQEFIKAVFRAASFTSFFKFAHTVQPQTQEQKLRFFETYRRIAAGPEASFDHPRLPGLPIVDPKLELYSGYLSWLIDQKAENPKEIAGMFTLPQERQSYSYSSRLTEPEVEALKQQYDSYFASLKGRSQAPVAEIRDRYIFEQIRKSMQQHPSDGAAAAAAFCRLDGKLADLLRNHFERYLPAFAPYESQALLSIIQSAKGRSVDENRFSSRVFEWMKSRLDQRSATSEDVRVFAQMFLQLAKASELRAVERDEVFEQLWQVCSDESRDLLSDPAVVGHLLTHARKRLILSHVFRTQVMPAPMARASDLTSVRPKVQLAHDTLKRLIPDPSDLRDAVVDEWSEDLVTNPAETDLMFTLATSYDNWYEAQGLVLLDLPQHFQKLISSKKEKFAFLQYFTGQIDLDGLMAVLGDRMGISQSDLRSALRGVLIRYRESQMVVRIYLLLALLDDLEGLLSDPTYAEQVYAMVLGRYADNEVAQASMHAYLDSVPSSEKRVLLSRVLAGQIDNPRGGGYVRSLVDGLKTMGYKGAQFLRAAGLVSPEMEPEFEGVFDRAIKPKRNIALKRFRQAWGDDLKGLTYFGRPLGYGSVNFVYEAEFMDPDTTERVDVAVRALHENVVGQIRNEMQVWEQTIPKLEADPRLSVRIIGGYLRDSLEAASETLREGGSEVDLKEDRRLIAEAAQVYQRQAGETHSGYRVQVVPVLQSIQNTVAKEVESQVSAHPLIRFTRLQEHPETKMLSLDALEVEANAAYVLGSFDLDGHPGNYLADSGQRVLWRTDVSQFRTITDSTTVAAQRKAMQLLLKPVLFRRDMQELSDLAPELFNVSSVEGLAPSTLQAKFRQLLEVYGTPENSPIGNLYFYRRKLDEALGACGALRFSQATVWYIQSAARNRIHSESTGRWGYYRTLAHAVGKSTVTAAMEFGYRAAKTCAETVLRTGRRLGFSSAK